MESKQFGIWFSKIREEKGEKIIMTDRDLLELIATQVGGLTTQFDSLTTQFNTLTTQFNSLTSQVSNITKIVTKIENDHGKKLSALFDGQKQHSDQLKSIITRLDSLEEKVENHDIRISVLNKRKKTSSK